MDNRIHIFVSNAVGSFYFRACQILSLLYFLAILRTAYPAHKLLSCAHNLLEHRNFPVPIMASGRSHLWNVIVLLQYLK